jgi:hypothetical protein
MDVSPKYLMEIIDKIEKTLWNLSITSKYKYVENYIKKWHISDNDSYSNSWENFTIYYSNGNIDLNQTLHNIKESELLLKIAIDIGIETLDFIPSIPVFKNKLKISYSIAFDSFSKAVKECKESPSLAIGAANATLETIIKHILEDKRLNVEWKEGSTLYGLSCIIFKKFELTKSCNENVSPELLKIGQGMVTACQSIENLRSRESEFIHGKTREARIIKDKSSAFFVVNSVATIGLFFD